MTNTTMTVKCWHGASLTFGSLAGLLLVLTHFSVTFCLGQLCCRDKLPQAGSSVENGALSLAVLEARRWPDSECEQAACLWAESPLPGGCLVDVTVPSTVEGWKR